MAHVPFANRAHIGGFHGWDSNRFAGERHELHFICDTAPVDVNYGANIARLQAFFSASRPSAQHNRVP